MKEGFGKRNPLAHMTVFFRKTFFEKAGLYPLDTNLDEDTMFWLNGFLNSCIFANLPQILVKVRVDSKFYGRRNGVKKSYSDFKNRLKIIRELDLAFINIIWAFGRFVMMSLPIAGITKFAYKYLRR